MPWQVSATPPSLCEPEADGAAPEQAETSKASAAVAKANIEHAPPFERFEPVRSVKLEAVLSAVKFEVPANSQL